MIIIIIIIWGMLDDYGWILQLTPWHEHVNCFEFKESVKILAFLFGHWFCKRSFSVMSSTYNTKQRVPNTITLTWLSFPDKNSFWRDIWYKDHFPKEQVVFGIMISILSSPTLYLYRVNGEKSYLFYFQVVTFNDLFSPISTWNHYLFFGISYYGLRLLRYAGHYGKWTS